MVLLVPFLGQGEQILVKFCEGHWAFGLVDAVIVTCRANNHAWFAIGEDHGLRDQDRTPLIRRLIRSSKFLDQPAVVLFFVLEMIPLTKFERILVLYPLDLFHDTFLEDKMGVFCLLPDYF